MAVFDVPALYALTSYSDLVAALNDWLDRGDLTGAAQQFIALAEARMRRELAPYFGETTTAINLTGGMGALPSDCGIITRVSYAGSRLPQLSPGAALDVPTTYSEPVGYTVETGGLRVWPNLDCVVSVLYEQSLVSLSEATPTNGLLDAHPDLYFYGAAMFALGYVANDERAALFKGLWDEALESAKTYLTRQRFAGPLVPRVAFVP